MFISPHRMYEKSTTIFGPPLPLLRLLGEYPLLLPNILIPAHPLASKSRMSRRIYIPNLGFLLNEEVHQILTFLILQVYNLNTPLLKICLTTHECIVLAHDYTSNSIEETGSCAVAGEFLTGWILNFTYHISQGDSLEINSVNFLHEICVYSRCVHRRPCVRRCWKAT